jgi:hypothetical protein
MQIKESGLGPTEVRLSQEAKRAWAALINAHYEEQRSVDFAPSLRGPWGKLEQYAGRIVLILHMLKLASAPHWVGDSIPEVQSATVGDAARLLDFLKSHTRRVYAAMHARARREEGSEDVQAILKWILRHAKASFSLRDLNRDLTRTFGGRARALDEALAWLINTNHIRRHVESDCHLHRRGRPRSAQYQVHPHLLASHCCQNRPYEEGAPPPEVGFCNSGDSATGSGIAPESDVDDDDIPF